MATVIRPQDPETSSEKAIEFLMIAFGPMSRCTNTLARQTWMQGNQNHSGQSCCTWRLADECRGRAHCGGGG